MTTIIKLIFFKYFMTFLQCCGQKVHNLDWTRVNNDDFVSFIYSPYNIIIPDTELMTASSKVNNAHTYDIQVNDIPPTNVKLF